MSSSSSTLHPTAAAQSSMEHQNSVAAASEQPSTTNAAPQQQQMHSSSSAASSSGYEGKSAIMRFRRAIINHVEHNSLKLVFPDDKDMSIEMLGVLASMLLNNMEDTERMLIIEGLVSLVTEYKDSADPQQRAKRSTYEKVIDEILRYAYLDGSLGLNQTIHGLILTSDFSLSTPLNLEKWRFIEENIFKLDYKGIQLLIRTILITQFKDVPLVLSSEQMRQLTPIENLLLQLLDRERNALPAIFSMTEASRGNIVRSSNIFPRLTATLSHLNTMFRPIADLTYVIGRPFMFPLPGHPAFLAAAPAWKMEGDCNKISHKPYYLPYRPELKQPQVYTLYMLLKQPRGKEYLPNIIRTANQHYTHTSPWEPLLSVFVCDVMCEAEKLPENSEISRYQWENLLSIFFNFVQIQHITISHIFKVLSSILEKTTYRRARDEVMWLALQLIGSFPSLLTRETITEAARLYNVLFNEEVVWTGASDHPLKLTRFLAAACMWTILDGTDGLPLASSSLQVQVNFIRSKVDTVNSVNSEQALLAVLANAYRSDSNVYKNVKQAFAYWLIGSPNENPEFISYKRTVINKFTPIQTQYLDSLTMRAKNHVYLVCTSALQRQSFQPNRLPSPALIDTMARLVQTMEYELSTKNFILLVIRTLQGALHAQPFEGARESCHIFYEILCYRIPNIAIPVHDRLSYIIIQTITAMIAMPYSIDYNQPPGMPPSAPHSVPCSISAFHLYSILEQTLIRQWAWTSHSDLLYCAISLFHRQLANSITHVHFYFAPGKHPEDFKRANQIGHFILNPNYAPVPEQSHFGQLSVEISRMFFISLFRAMKIMGVETSQECELYSLINQNYKWSSSQLLSFPPEVAASAQPMSEEQLLAEDKLLKAAVNEDVMACQGMVGGTYIDYMLNQLKSSKPLTLFCVVHSFLHMRNGAADDIKTIVYAILEHYQPRHVSMATNALVDYVISLMSSTNDKADEDLIIRYLMQLVFEWQLLSFDRLLLSLVLRPTTDRQSQIAIGIVSAFCSEQCTHLFNRLGSYLQHVPARRDNNLAEFFRRLTEYHNTHPELTYLELNRRCSGVPSDSDFIDPLSHMPTYYGSLIERLLPIIDYTLVRALELGTSDLYFVPILATFGKLYRYHPSPISFVYTTLFTLHEHIGNTERARSLAMHILAPLKTTSDESPLTQSFIVFNHQQASNENIINELVDRLVQSSEFLISPPSFCSLDWRFAELPPATQTLYLGCTELMAIPNKPENIVLAMINYLSGHRHNRPYTILNALALILTALPASYGKILQDEFLSVIGSDQLESLNFEDIIFDNFEESMLLSLPNRAMVISVMLQAYWQHANVVAISKYASEYVTALFQRVNTENGLWYALRLVMPLLQRCQDMGDRHKQIVDICNVARQLIFKLADLAEKNIEFIHQDELCDLLYHIKYTFIGDFLRREAEASFAKLWPRMRERLKFFTSQSASSSASASGKHHAHDDNIMSKLSTSMRPELLSSSLSMAAPASVPAHLPSASSSSSHLNTLSLSRTASDAGTSVGPILDLHTSQPPPTSTNQQHQVLTSKNSGFF